MCGDIHTAGQGNVVPEEDFEPMFDVIDEHWVSDDCEPEEDDYDDYESAVDE